ncbi:MAG: ferredoxin--NADP reductase [Capnocytophaga sp.]|nr:ferredoxin--NADP reductase [Capnocytophaga sp.]
MKSFPLKVSHIQKLTEDAVKISLEIPENERLSFDFFAGQYVTLQAEINGNKIRRAYSICSAPSEKEISVAIKQIPNGIFSTFANTTLKEGDFLEVFVPEGKFAYISEIYTEDLVFFAAGSGITPMLSIIKVALAQTTQKILLIYGNKTPQSTMFLSEIEELRKQNSDRFFVQYIYSKSHEKEAFFGRMDTTMINHLLKNKYASIPFGRFYICGPQQMVISVKDYLSENYDKKKIHTELFVVEAETKKVYEGTAQIKVFINGIEEDLQIQRKNMILDELLANEIEVSYSCRGGVCSSCIGKITEGSAEMEKNQVLSEEEVAKGYILTCQSHPITDKLTIEFR